MGEARRKRDRFIRDHPICCFCGGNAVAETIDHVPSRHCFVGRHGPDSFEFPACMSCNNVSRLDEMIFGFLVRLADVDDANFREKEFQKAVTGVINNAPHILPILDIPAREKRRSLKEMRIEKPFGWTWREAPLAGLPTEIHDHIGRVLRKLALALYYREQGKAAAADHCIWVIWCQATDPMRMERLEQFVSITPLKTLGIRPNINFGNQFAYRCNKSLEPDIFAALAQFGLGIVAAMVVVSSESASRMEFGEWVTVENAFK